MKRKLLLLTLMLVIVVCALAISVSATNVDGIYYTFNGETATVNSNNRANCTLEDVVIPSTVEYEEKTYTVTAIANSAFGSTGDYSTNNKSIVNLTIPETLTSIGEHAFRNISTLKTVTIKATNLEKFTNAEFYGCTALTTVDMSACTGFKSFGGNQWGHAFYDCKSLTSIKLPPNLEAIKWSTFQNCTALKSIDLPKTLNTISSNAFNNAGLESIVIPDAVTYLSDYAFQSCKSLTSVKLPKNLTYLGKNNFQYSKVTEIIIPATVTTIQNHVFHDSTVTKVIFATKNVTSFNNQAFDGAKSLKIIFFPGTETEAKTMFAKDNKTTGWTNYIDYASYDENEAYTNTIVYNTDLCSNCYDFAPELEVVVKDLVTSINNEAICTCGAGTSEVLYEAPITYLGFSKKIGENGSICIGYEVNSTSMEKYEELTGKTYTYGVVAYIPEANEDKATLKPINDDLTLKDEKYTIKAETTGYASFEFILKGFSTDAEKATELVMSAYVSDGTSVNYLGINQETNEVAQTEFATLVTYNGFVVAEE